MAKLVNWYQFSRNFKERGILIFSSIDICRLFKVSRIAATFLLHRYTKKGYIVRIRRGLYAFPDALPPDPYVANKIYEPSYISLEFALSYHGVIPEAVYEITSVTTKATRRFKFLGKVYSYRKVLPTAFTGYSVHKQMGFSFIIADPEKSLVDLSYFRIRTGMGPISRLSREKIDRRKALDYSRLFHNERLTKVIKQVLQ